MEFSLNKFNEFSESDNWDQFKILSVTSDLLVGWLRCSLSGGSKGGAPGAPPTAQNFLDFMQFWEILTKSYVGALPRESAPPATGNPGSAPVAYHMRGRTIAAFWFLLISCHLIHWTSFWENSNLFPCFRGLSDHVFCKSLDYQNEVNDMYFMWTKWRPIISG